MAPAERLASGVNDDVKVVWTVVSTVAVVTGYVT
jgi:hypothetical protein